MNPRVLVLVALVLSVVLDRAAAMAQTFAPTVDTVLDLTEADVHTSYFQNYEFFLSVMEEAPGEVVLEFDRGSYDFTGLAVDDSIGSLSFDLTVTAPPPFPPLTYTGTIECDVRVFSLMPLTDSMEAKALVTYIDPLVLSYIVTVLMVPTPVMSYAFTFTLANVPGGGTIQTVINHHTVPLGGLPSSFPGVVEASWLIDPVFLLPSTPGPLVATTTLSSTPGSLTVTHQETFLVSGGGSPGFVRGNCNGLDAAVNIADAIYLLGSLFPPAGGVPNPQPCRDACDSNDDGLINIADGVALLSSLFGAPAIPLPLPNTASGCEDDPPPVPPAVDPLDCMVPPPC